MPMEVVLVALSVKPGQLARLVKALGLLPEGPGFEPDLAPTHIKCLLSPPWQFEMKLSSFYTGGAPIGMGAVSVHLQRLACADPE